MAADGRRQNVGAPAESSAGASIDRQPVVGLVVQDLTNPFWADVAAGVEARAAERGRLVVVSSVQRVARRREVELVSMYRDLGVEGLILSSFLPQRTLRAHLADDLPTVLVARQGHPLGVSSISVDETAVMDVAFAHVLALGHRRTAFVNGSTDASWCAERRQGWLEALRQRGLHGSSLHLEITAPDIMRDPGNEVVAQLLRMRPMPTAILCANDVLAIDVLRALRAAGVAVPDHLSVLTVDDTLLASVSSPPLTAVRQDAVALGRAALDLLLDAGDCVRNVVTAPELVVRSSTGAPPPERTPGRPPRVAATRRRADGAADVLERIRAASMAMIDEAGAEAITARSLAQRAGISLGTLAYHLNTDDLRDRLWQEVEVELLSQLAGATGLLDGARRMVDWLEHHQGRARFYVSHAPDPQRPISDDVLAFIGAAPSDVDSLEPRRVALCYLARRMQAAAEYSMLAPDRAGSIGMLADELDLQASLWRSLILRGDPVPE